MLLSLPKHCLQAVGQLQLESCVVPSVPSETMSKDMTCVCCDPAFLSPCTGRQQTYFHDKFTNAAAMQFSASHQDEPALASLQHFMLLAVQ